MMNRNLLPYYLSRAVFSVIFGGIFFLSGSPLWEAALMAGLLLALFIWAPHSGRYAVHPEFGITALSRDERTQLINDKAARNAFVVIMLLIGAAAFISAQRPRLFPAYYSES
jgi:hypothetical protein